MRKHLVTNIMQFIMSAYGIYAIVQNIVVLDWTHLELAIAALGLLTIVFQGIRYQEDIDAIWFGKDEKKDKENKE